MCGVIQFITLTLRVNAILKGTIQYQYEKQKQKQSESIMNVRNVYWVRYNSYFYIAAIGWPWSSNWAYGKYLPANVSNVHLGHDTLNGFFF